jgi:hypothetical protein
LREVKGRKKRSLKREDMDLELKIDYEWKMIRKRWND